MGSDEEKGKRDIRDGNRNTVRQKSTGDIRNSEREKEGQE